MRRKWLILATLAALLLGVLASPAVADDDDDDDDDGRDSLICTDFGELIDDVPGVPPFQFIFNETLRGDVVVPSGVDCTFVGSTIKGDLTVMPNESPDVFTGGFLFDGSKVTGDVTVGSSSVLVVFTPPSDYQGPTSVVRGDVECESCLFMGIFFSKIRGDVTLTGIFDGTFIEQSTIRGDLEIVDSFSQPESAPILVAGNLIKGDLTLEDNQGPPDSIIVSDNVIKGDLECEGNTPAPIGGNNKADEKEGQCSNL